jgi:hypothetical protein
MNSSGCFLRVLVRVAGASLALFGASCANVFRAKHKVLVDAISAPGLPKQEASSYRLVAKPSMLNQSQAQVAVIKACVDAALSSKGMFEAPANSAPDVFIEIRYGVDASGRVDPSARETFLQLSGRANPERAVDRATGEEIWDVRVAVLGIAGRMETAMPLLSAVAVDYMGTDTKLETKIDVPQNAPVIAAVRETAIKALEGKPAPVPTGTAPAPASGTGPAPVSNPPPPTAQAGKT